MRKKIFVLMFVIPFLSSCNCSQNAGKQTRGAGAVKIPTDSCPTGTIAKARTVATAETSDTKNNINDEGNTGEQSLSLLCEPVSPITVPPPPPTDLPEDDKDKEEEKEEDKVEVVDEAETPPVIDQRPARLATHISTGTKHSCAILDSGVLKCWGDNSLGQLGQGNYSQTGSSSGTSIAELSVINLGSGLTATQLATGDHHTCALLSDSSVKCWGKNEYGQLGLGHKNKIGLERGDMGEALKAVDFGEGITVSQITAGENHSCALLSDKTVKCWGINTVGQLGQGSSVSSSSTVGSSTSNLISSLAAVHLGTDAKVAKISAGSNHTCALLEDSSLKCWGLNDKGQLGDTTTVNKGLTDVEMTSLAAVNTGSKTISEINAGNNHTCVVFTDASSRCWGKNDEAQLGQNSDTNLLEDPNAIADISLSNTVKKISAGTSHTCAILNDDSVKCWGFNDFGQLGPDTAIGTNIGDATVQMDTLTSINLGTGKTAKKIALGGDQSCAILNDDTLKCWGQNSSGQLAQGHNKLVNESVNTLKYTAIDLGAGKTAVEVSSGSSHICTILNDGSVKCWGSNEFGQLGQGNTFDIGSSKTGIYDLDGVYLGDSILPTQISISSDHSCVLLDDGKVKCWGKNDKGQLGQEHANNIGLVIDDLTSLESISVSSSRKVTQIVTGESHTCVLLDNTTVQCWGDNDYGQLGFSEDISPKTSKDIGDEVGEMASLFTLRFSSDTKFEGSTNLEAYQISAGAHHTCAIMSKLKKYWTCWGLNGSGQLGNDDTQMRFHHLTLGLISNDIGLKWNHYGDDGELLQISAGSYHTCALWDNGRIRCWGANNVGQLGQGNTISRGDSSSDDRKMGKLAFINLGSEEVTAKEISAGGYHTCALLTDGQVKCWGNNIYGQLGQGHFDNIGDHGSEMEFIANSYLGEGRTAIKISAGMNHTCALLDDSSVKCWGLNTSGQLGLGHTKSIGKDTLELKSLLRSVDL